MKNPFVKEDESSLVIVAVAIGAILAGAIAYLYTKKNGNPFVNKVGNVTEEVNEHTTDYLKKKSHPLKKKTTDLHEIEDIVRS